MNQKLNITYFFLAQILSFGHGINVRHVNFPARQLGFQLLILFLEFPNQFIRRILIDHRFGFDLFGPIRYEKRQSWE